MMQTVIDWIPGYPEDAQKHERWWVMLRGYDLPCIMTSDTAEKSALITHHAPIILPKEEPEIMVQVSAVESIVEHAYRLKCMHDMYNEIMNRLPDKYGAPLRIPKGEYGVPNKIAEKQRYIELGKAIEAAFEAGGHVRINEVISAICHDDTLIEWHRAEVERG